MALPVFDRYIHFLCLPKENEPKERAPVVFGPSDCLVLLDHAGNFQTRFAQTGEDSFFGLFCDAQLMLMGFV